jgi:hypothetical protein
MTDNQIRKLPAGALLQRKKYQIAESHFILVVQSSEKDPQPGVGITVAFGQEDHPFYNVFDVDPNLPPEDRDEWRNPTRWIVHRVPVEDETHKTWWRNWKRIA